MPNVGSWKIESEGEADEYLKDLLSKPEYRRVDELLLRAQAHVPDKEIRVYFINKGREMLRTYMHERIVGSSLSIVKNVGHCPHLSAPGPSKSATEEFLKNLHL